MPRPSPLAGARCRFLASCSQRERAGRARRCRGAISEHQKGLGTRQGPPGTAGVHHAEGEHHGPSPRVRTGLALLQLKPAVGANPASSATAKCSLPPPGGSGCAQSLLQHPASALCHDIFIEARLQHPHPAPSCLCISEPGSRDLRECEWILVTRDQQQYYFRQEVRLPSRLSCCACQTGDSRAAFR